MAPEIAQRSRGRCSASALPGGHCWDSSYSVRASSIGSRASAPATSRERQLEQCAAIASLLQGTCLGAPHMQTSIQTSNTHRSIESFLKSRQRLIVELMRTSHALEHNDFEQSQCIVERFCEQLVDYVSTSYFGLFGTLSPTSWTTPREY